MRAFVVCLVVLGLGACVVAEGHAVDTLSLISRQQITLELDDLDKGAFIYDHLEAHSQIHSTDIKTRRQTVYRPRSPAAYQSARWRSLRYGESEAIEWDRIELRAPDVRDRHTLVQLGRMAGDAYAFPGNKNWYDIDEIWNTTFPVGWEDPADGFRAHVFATPSNSTVVLSIKGTTINGPTSKKDKFNDNLLFSCCCARVDISWVFRQVCGCHSKGWKCDSGCLTEALVEESLFYSVGVTLIHNLTSMYPNSDIWLVGHSLGGSLAALLGTTFGFPAVAFEAPGERLAATRLHLPLPPSSDPSVAPQSLAPVTHVYHNADPIPQGTCSGPFSPCAEAGYALESRCHLGKSIIYDTVSELGWKVDVRTHPIRRVIKEVLELDRMWEEDGHEVPRERAEGECIDCYKWEFGDFKDRD
ncbi:alpha/beta-hydrolase [Punctularia strigosozonata HHB-11173 SS5]|uniref:alpha/beta-hydrolase n=1 Tax=Punctularia strigosozonata (strain HHB-11173) TaxID=741275 RepID=UPI0004416F6E|nr:alpha/beta-hydrolase [Punctularia strigosozonata HHB-11173 SS5]EIN07181.1 alpha/beta-hydrolase [Punctularia strigosozonata HHB-11173 SS5]